MAEASVFDGEFGVDDIFYPGGSGFTDGNLLFGDLGWCLTKLSNELGIERVIGLKGYLNTQHFHEWVSMKVGIILEDWEAVVIDLYQVWYEPVCYPEGPPVCTMSWSSLNCDSALKSEKVSVYAIRHKSFSGESQRRKALDCSRQKSIAISLWKGANGATAPVNIAQIDTDIFVYGCYLTGVAPGSDIEVPLIWPDANLERTLEMAEDFKSQGYQDLCIYEDDFGVQIDEFPKWVWEKAIQEWKHLSFEPPLMELLEDYLDDED